ncbi:MAG: hypothetical protein QOD03_1159 [Verrucomicrobiota bacterium]|jgi:hypothetical protein
MPVLLLMLLGTSIATGTGIILLVLHWRAKHSAEQTLAVRASSLLLEAAPAQTSFLPRPTSWLAIRSRNVTAVQEALGLHNPQPCSWAEGLSENRKLFIAPPVNGWILILGSGLPDPDEDVDSCFHFLLNLTRKLGHVQFFSANRVLGHHAWVRAEGGHIARAYAWAGKTLWNQGTPTRAERDLGLHCFQYFETPDEPMFNGAEASFINSEKVPLLAARWSLDPTAIDDRFLEHAFGIAGEL